MGTINHKSDIMSFDNINILTINRPNYGTFSFILKRITYRERNKNHPIY